MSIETTESFEDVKVFGNGSMGGKGTGLVQISQSPLPRANKLKTWILTTSFYDRYLERNKRFGDEELRVVGRILDEIGDSPLGVRSSATNEAVVSIDGSISVHAGENTTFMLPNNHPEPSVRFTQTIRAIYHIYEDFTEKQEPDSRERMAIVINPIPGIYDDTLAGPLYYPYISGVANSFFPYALKSQDPNDGVARIAFGHGYATVLDDFPVISMVTIKNPIPPDMLKTGKGQQFFYALDMTKNRDLGGDELETMKRLHVRFANYHKIRLLGIQNNLITIEELIQNDHYGFRTGLSEIMDMISSRISARFQIEFVFNIDFQRKDRGDGLFHVVQLTRLPEMSLEAVAFPDETADAYLSIGNCQGQGVKRGIKYAVVVSPKTYSKDSHDAVRREICEVNRRMREQNDDYLLIVPGRLGSKNRDWGIFVDYKDVDRAVAIFEYGVDVAGRPEPLPGGDDQKGGIYGSHFLYMIQGGHDEDQRRLQTRMYGTQGTHFLTNLMSNNVIYGYIAPAMDAVSPWFFAAADDGGPVSVLTFPHPAAVYADSTEQRCVVIAEGG
ncbi:MAG: hypothetical protein ABIJ00_07240 [Candidatus Eisenbacteria bacterium]